MNPEQWTSFFVLVGSGSAALAGLVFVAITINLRGVAEDATHRYRAINMLTGFSSAFIVSALALMGQQTPQALGLSGVQTGGVARQEGRLIVRGSIRKRSNGSWTVIVDLGPDPQTGKRRQLWRSVKGPKREAEAELVRLLHDKDAGLDRPTGKLTVGAYLERWLADYVRVNLAPKTHASYTDAIHGHFTPALGALELTALRPTHIQGLYSRMLVSGRRDGRGGLSARSVGRYHQILHAALHQAVRWQLLVRNPADAVEAPRAPRREIATVSAEQARRLMAAGDETTIGPFVRLALLTGMRRGELLGLRWSDVDLDGAKIHVQQTAQRIDGQGIVFRHPKTRLSRRAIALSPDAVIVLRSHRRRQAEARLLAGPAYVDHDLVFATGIGTPIEPSNLRRSWLAVTESAGLPGLRIHDLRHAHATIMLGQGVHPKIVSERLGHASVNITLDTYSHVLPGLQEAAAAQLDAVFAEPPVAEAR
jgi:integrase